MNQQNQHPAGSAFKAHGDRREYNVYIETATVEDAWCRIPEWPLSSQVVPLLVSLEIALKILDDCLRETGARRYVNDASKAETVAACVGSLLTLIAEIAFEYQSAMREHAREEWKRLFSESPNFEDPKGTKPYVSEWNLDVFFRNFEKLFPRVKEVEHDVVEYGSNHLTVEWRISAESFLNGMDARFGGKETFHFDPGGRILVAVAEWQPGALAQDLMRRYRAALSKTV